MKKSMIALALALSLSACVTLPQGQFENRVACSLAKDKAFVVSEYGPVGLSNTISVKDTAAICK